MNIIKNFRNFKNLIINSWKGNSLCRSFQLEYVKKQNISGSIIEFGNDSLEKSFIKHLNKKKIHLSQKNIFFSDIKKSKDIRYIELDLEKKNFIKKKFNNVLIFNVFEHVFNTGNALSEIKKIMYKNSTIYISTPFLYRYHGAPDDYLRFTKSYWSKILKKNGFKILESKNYGSGPFMASYSMLFDYFKKIYFINPFLLTTAIVLDKLLSIFQKTKMSNLYCICVILKAKRND